MQTISLIFLLVMIAGYGTLAFYCFYSAFQSYRQERLARKRAGTGKPAGAPSGGASGREGRKPLAELGGNAGNDAVDGAHRGAHDAAASPHHKPVEKE